MVKELSEIIHLNQINAEAFFRLIYIDCRLLRRFHAEVNQCEAATVPSWDSTRQRTLIFTTPLNAPAFITSLVGSDTISVHETQSFTLVGGQSFKIESNPVPQMRGSEQFLSTATLTIENKPVNGDSGGGGCVITATVQVTANGPWGLTGAIENFMISAAKDSLTQFLDFCTRYVSEIASAPEGLEQALGRIPQVAEILDQQPPPSAVDHIEEGADFYDAEEMPATPSTVADAIDFSRAPPQELAELAVLYLKYLSRTADETNVILRSIDERVAKLEAAAKAPVLGFRRLDRSFLAAVVPSGATLRQTALLAGVAVTSAAITTLFWNYKTKSTRYYSS